MAYICGFDKSGHSREDNELLVEWLEADGSTAAEIKYVREKTCKDVETRCCYWECSECGVQLENPCEYPTLWLDGKAIYPSFCPNCGAKVVE